MTQNVETTPLLLSNYYVPSLYDLNLFINHLKPNFSGQITIDLVKNTLAHGTPAHFTVTLHASKLIITSAKLGETKLKVTTNRELQQVTLSSEDITSLPDSAQITLAYMGQINTIKTYQDSTQGLFKTNYLDSVSGKSNNYILATHFQPHSAKLVFPLIDELSLKVPIQLSITTSNKFKVLSNSKLADTQHVSMSEDCTYTFEPTPPIAASVFGFVLGDFEFLQSESSDIRVYTSIGESRYALYTLELIEKFLPILEELFGVKYPLSKLDFVGVPFLNDGAMENWGLVTVLSNQILLDRATANLAAKHQLQQLVAHELVHQWIGNLVTFDDWKNLWLNEAFATWLGSYVIAYSKINDDKDYNYNLTTVDAYEKFFDKDCLITEGDQLSIPSIHAHTNKLNTGLNSVTSAIFDANAYDKGIILINMIATVMQYDSPEAKDFSNFFKGFGRVIEKYKYKSVKAFDIWNVLNEQVSIDLLSFVHSWTRNPGFPLVTVKADESLSKLIFEQHLFLYNLTPQQLNMEDKPFHIPLLVDIVDEKGTRKVLDILLTDRSLTLDIPAKQLITINARRGGYYRLVYSPELIEQTIVPRIVSNELSGSDLIALIHDYGKRVGTEQSTSSDLVSLIKIIKALGLPNWTLDYVPLKVALNYLETINNILLHFSEYTVFQEWLDKFIVVIFDKIGSWDRLYHSTKVYSTVEMQVRNSVLQLGLKKKEFQEIGKKVFKNFISSGLHKCFTPKEILLSVFNLVMYNGTQKEYKRVLEFVKNANVSILNNTNVSNTELQTIAVSSISFATNPDLLNKALNFVMTNIDSKLIELGLIGFQYKTNKQDKLKLFHWYTLHYKEWVNKSLRKGSDWAKQLGVTVQNISRIVLGEVMQYDDDLVKARTEFVAKMLVELPPHGLQELVEEEDGNNHEKELIGACYPELVASL